MTNGSGRAKNIRIRIRNTGIKYRIIMGDLFIYLLPSPNCSLRIFKGQKVRENENKQRIFSIQGRLKYSMHDVNIPGQTYAVRYAVRYVVNT